MSRVLDVKNGSASVGIDHLFDILELVTKVLSLSHRQAVVVEAAHLLSECATSVVEGSHTSDLSVATLESAVSLAGEEASWHVGSQFVVVCWFLNVVALSSHQFATNGIIARPVGGSLFVGPVRHWRLAESSNTTHLEQTESWNFLCNHKLFTVGGGSFSLLSVRIASFDILDCNILAGITFAARVNVSFLGERVISSGSVGSRIVGTIVDQSCHCVVVILP